MKQESVCYIGIHPYTSLGIYERQKGFVDIRNQRLNDSNSDQFLFIESRYYADTIKKFELNSERWKDRIVVTENADPVGATFEDVTAMILEMSPADIYLFWGAELVLLKGQAVGGCVQYVYSNLMLSNKIIDIKRCFQAPYAVFKASRGF